MSRRFQFSLKGLLVAIVLTCIALGSWRIYVIHFASRIESDLAVAGKPFLARGRLFVFGNHPSAFTVQLASRGAVQEQSMVDIPQDFGWGTFEFEVEMSPMPASMAGDYDIQIRLGNEVVAKGPATVSRASR
jgi:hypothetical protein